VSTGGRLGFGDCLTSQCTMKPVSIKNIRDIPLDVMLSSDSYEKVLSLLLFIYLFIYAFIYLFMYLFIYLFIIIVVIIIMDFCRGNQKEILLFIPNYDGISLPSITDEDMILHEKMITYQSNEILTI